MQIDILLQAERLSRICTFCYDSNNLLIKAATTTASSGSGKSSSGILDNSRTAESKNNINVIITEGSETSYINHDSDNQEEGYAVDVTYGFFSRSYDPSLKVIRKEEGGEETPPTFIASPSDDNDDNNNNNNEDMDNNSVSSTQSFSLPASASTSYNPINDSKVRVVKYSQYRDSSPNIIKEPDDVGAQYHLNEVTQLRKCLLALPGANELLTDEDCLRFLKSKNYHVPKTTVMIKQWFQWWNSPLPGFTDVMPKNILTYVNEKEHIAADILLHANFGEDKEGHPIYWEKTGYGMMRMMIVMMMMMIMIVIMRIMMMAMMMMRSIMMKMI